MLWIIGLVAVALFSPSALAHSGSTDGGFLAGIQHPVLGPDHLLAMLSVGIVSAMMGGRAIWTVPLTFVVFMIVGGLLGMERLYFPGVELGIAISVILLGAAIAFDRGLSVTWVMAFVALFGIVHGHAHGYEMPALAKPWTYALGFTVGTAGIHIAGVFIALPATRHVGYRNGLRVVGAAIVAAGVYFLI